MRLKEEEGGGVEEAAPTEHSCRFLETGGPGACWTGEGKVGRGTVV